MSMRYEDIVNSIKKEAGLGEEEIKLRVNKKLELLSGLISKEGAAHIIANELGIKLLDDISLRRFKINKIITGMRSLELIGKVIRKFDAHEFNNGTRSGKVGSFLIADETGTVKVVLWGEQCKQLDEIKDNDVVKVKNASVKENNKGFKELHLNDRSKVEINPAGETLGEVVLVGSQGQLKKINEINDGDNVEIAGWILEVFEPRFYASCPFCNKKAEVNDGRFICGEHGPINERMVAILNMFVDDGTGVVRVVCFRDQAEKILGLDNDGIQMLRENLQAFEDVKNKIKGRHVVMNGRVKRNEMFDRLEFIVSNFNDSDPRNMAQNLLKEVEFGKIS